MRDCLIDSGAEVSIFPVRCVQKEWLQETDEWVQDVNRNEVSVVGKVVVPVQMPGFEGTVRAVVSDSVCEPILGFDWLRDSGGVLDLGDNRLRLNS